MSHPLRTTTPLQNRYVSAAIHILRVNCAETIRDRPGQRAHKMFGIKRRLQRCKVRRPRLKGSSVRVHQIWVPLQNARFLLLSSNQARERLQRHTLAAQHNKHWWRAFRRYQHRWPWTTLYPQNRGFNDFFAILSCGAHLESEFWLKLLEINQDKLRTKLYWCCRAYHVH